MRTQYEIVTSFIHNGFIPMKGLTTTVFHTDNSASTLVWVENNVVIEHYYLFPLKITPLHSHPFENQIIFMGGDLFGKVKIFDESPVKDVIFTQDMIGKLHEKILKPGMQHGFETGKAGAIIYNIQYWSFNVEEYLSATLHYKGEPMGIIHKQQLALREKNVQPGNKT